MTDYDPTTALIVVDVQNDFADPTGSLSVAGGTEVIPVINADIETALAAGAKVFYTQDWHPESTPHFEKDGGLWPVHCVADTWGAELHPGLRVEGPVVRKGVNGEDGYSGFTTRDPETGWTRPTELDELLRQPAWSSSSWPAWPPTTASWPRPSTGAPAATPRRCWRQVCGPSSSSAGRWREGARGVASGGRIRGRDLAA